MAVITVLRKEDEATCVGRVHVSERSPVIDGSDQVTTSPDEGKPSSSLFRLDHLFHACASDHKLLIQPIIHDTDGVSPGSSASFMLYFVDPSTGVMCYQSIEMQLLDGDVSTGSYYLCYLLTTTSA